MSEETAALDAVGLGMRYGRRRPQVLTDCSFRLPTGRIAALVGANGVGKSTLLRLAAGLLRPIEGELRVLGGAPGEMRNRVAYVAQDKPLYPQLTIAETLSWGSTLNHGRWDQDAAERIAYANGLSGEARVRHLSGGDRTRVALALAVGKRAGIMLLDEPMADLDPLARHELAGVLLAEAAECGTTVVMSSHVVAELEYSCDHLLLLSGGRVRLAGATDDLLAAHVRLTGKEQELDPHAVVEQKSTGRGVTALVRSRGDVEGDWVVERPTLEELILAHLRNPGAEPLVTADTVQDAQEATV